MAIDSDMLAKLLQIEDVIKPTVAEWHEEWRRQQRENKKEESGMEKIQAGDIDPERKAEWDEWLPELITDIGDGYIDEHLKPLMQAILKRRDVIDPAWKTRMMKVEAERTGKPVVAAQQVTPQKEWEDGQTVQKRHIFQKAVLAAGLKPDADGNLPLDRATVDKIKDQLDRMPLEAGMDVVAEAAAIVSANMDNITIRKSSIPFPMYDPMQDEPSIARGIVRKGKPKPKVKAAPVDHDYESSTATTRGNGTPRRSGIPGGRTRAKVDWDSGYGLTTRKINPVAWVDEDINSTSRTVTVSGKNYLRSELIGKVFTMNANWAQKYNLWNVHCQIVGAKTKVQLAFRSEPDKSSNYHKIWAKKEAAFFPIEVLESILK